MGLPARAGLRRWRVLHNRVQPVAGLGLMSFDGPVRGGGRLKAGRVWAK
ncbi:MAG: hypothetical protein AVDCRST_MAG64-1462 [uncultured Phycisphaerae bacterium]|uniref:Uncharacterized protein n=1 Tax=uncultured Phycisphaerae bacterium TaxID=904963 RepID=A0A6J4NVR0_9BACT|nr:MAG: hypothetical protein AVDCRST_MAG64-1462 [uncultured Phycisphaerae bacterium]